MIIVDMKTCLQISRVELSSCARVCHCLFFFGWLTFCFCLCDVLLLRLPLLLCCTAITKLLACASTPPFLRAFVIIISLDGLGGVTREVGSDRQRKLSLAGYLCFWCCFRLWMILLESHAIHVSKAPSRSQDWEKSEQHRTMLTLMVHQSNFT